MGIPARTIDDLDNKSLQHIFSYLSLVDKLKISLILDDFNDLIKDALRNEIFDAFQVQTTFSLPDAKCILHNYGKFLRKYQCETTCKVDFLSLITEYCTKMEEIVLSGCEIKDNAHSKLLYISENLKSLTLRKCVLGIAATCRLDELRQLKVLNLEDCSVHGQYLSRLRNLTELNIKNCRNINARDFIEICKSNKLKKVNAEGLEQLTIASAKTLVETRNIVCGQQVLAQRFKSGIASRTS